MGFDTEKRKFPNTWEKSFKNNVDIQDAKRIEQKIITNIDQLNRKNTIIKNIFDISTDWLIPETEFRSSDGLPIRSFKEFQIILEKVNPVYIPYIYVDFIFRTSDSVPSAPIPLNPDFDPEFPQFFTFDSSTSFDLFTNGISQVEDIEGEDILKKVTYTTSMLIENEVNGIPDLEFRFLARLLNPFYYN